MLAAFLPALNQCCSVSLQQLFLNELVLADAIQALNEIYQAIEESECDFASAVVTNPQQVKEGHRDVLDLLGN